jgi:hypothetical protein
VNLYPWAFANDPSARGARGFGNTSVYRISVDHTHGSLVSYLDGATQNVFREVQRKQLVSIPLDTRVANNTTSLRLQVNTTHESGPMHVEVTRPKTGLPVVSEVTVDGERVGTTDTDGDLWTVRPRGPTRINATTASGDRVTLRFSG